MKFDQEPLNAALNDYQVSQHALEGAKIAAGAEVGKAMGAILVDLVQEGRFDRYLQSAVQGLLANGGTDIGAIVPTAMRIASEAIVAADQYQAKLESA